MRYDELILNSGQKAKMKEELLKFALTRSQTETTALLESLKPYLNESLYKSLSEWVTNRGLFSEPWVLLAKIAHFGGSASSLGAQGLSAFSAFSEEELKRAVYDYAYAKLEDTFATNAAKIYGLGMSKYDIISTFWSGRESPLEHALRAFADWAASLMEGHTNLAEVIEAVDQHAQSMGLTLARLVGSELAGKFGIK